jgi:hypothetical protein
VSCLICTLGEGICTFYCVDRCCYNPFVGYYMKTSEGDKGQLEELLK